MEPNAAERAHSDIRAAIMRGEFLPGAMLSESNLAHTLAMSRTPVRAALARLQDEGLVTIYPKRGALVRELTAAEIRESAQLRHALESAGVQLADEHSRKALQRRLSANLNRQERALSRGKFPAFTELAMQFHRGFVELTNNSMMLATYDRLQDRQYLSIVRSAPTLTRDAQRILEEHRSLVAAAASGDWVSFALELRSHQTQGNELE